MYSGSLPDFPKKVAAGKGYKLIPAQKLRFTLGYESQRKQARGFLIYRRLRSVKASKVSELQKLVRGSAALGGKVGTGYAFIMLVSHE